VVVGSKRRVKIVYNSFNGGYSDSPRAVYEAALGLPRQGLARCQ
jgi:hypothetical protein